jgi:photoactive yellow protein
MASNIPDFHDPDLASIVEMSPVEVVHALPFGAIRLNREGQVVFYSEAERRLSGYNKEPLTRSFFTEIAPCMNNPEFRGRIDKALKAGKLNITFSYIGDFANPDQELDVRIQSATGGGCWIFMRRL